MPVNSTRSRWRAWTLICFALLLSCSPVAAQEMGWLGLVVADLTPAEALKLGVPNGGGAYVIEVIAKSPGELAGILANDIILRLDGKKIEAIQTLVCSLAGKHPGDIIRLTMFRKKQLRSFVAE